MGKTFRQAIQPRVLELRFVGNRERDGGFWKLTTAVDLDQVIQSFPIDTHPRLMAQAIYSAHWEALARGKP